MRSHARVPSFASMKIRDTYCATQTSEWLKTSRAVEDKIMTHLTGMPHKSNLYVHTFLSMREWAQALHVNTLAPYYLVIHAD